MKRAIHYLRVSSKEQAREGHVSLETQDERCHAMTTSNGWQHVQTIKDVDSGYGQNARDRKGWNEAIQRIRDGEAEVIVVWHTSRWGRDVEDGAWAYKRLVETGAVLASVSEGFVFENEVQYHIAMAMNREYSRQLGKNTSNAKLTKVQNGYWVATAPTGLINDKGILKPGPDFDIVQQIFEWAATGRSVREIVKLLNLGHVATREGRPWHAATVHGIISNVAYIGKLPWKGTVYDGTWLPLVSREIFNRANELIQARAGLRTKLTPRQPFWIHGLAFCGHCGRKLQLKVDRPKASKRFKEYAYLLCGAPRDYGLEPCFRRTVPVADISAWVIEQVQGLRLRGAARFLDDYAAHEARQLAEYQHRRSELEASILTEESRIAEIERNYFDTSLGISRERMTEIKAGATALITAMRLQLQAMPVPASESGLSGLSEFMESADWLDARDEAPEGFRDVLRLAVPRVLVDGRGSYRLEVHPALESIRAEARA